MSLLQKILVWIGVVLLFGVLGFLVYKQIEISNRQIAIETQIVEQKQLVDGLVRSQSTWATRDDVNKFISENNINLRAIQDDLDKLHAEITAVNISVATSKGQSGTGIGTTPGPIVSPTPVDPKNPDPYGYLTRQQLLSLHEEFDNIQVPIGTVGFSAWKEKPWDYQIKGREYKASTVVGMDENQRTYYYNKFTVNVDGKEYVLPIKTATSEQVYPEAKFSWINPRLFLTVGAGVDLTSSPMQAAANGGVTLGISSYGKYKTSPDISILQFGVAYETLGQRPAAILNPVNINIGGTMAKGLINNTYIGPSLQLNTAGHVFAGVNMSVGL